MAGRARETVAKGSPLFGTAPLGIGEQAQVRFPTVCGNPRGTPRNLTSELQTVLAGLAPGLHQPPPTTRNLQNLPEPCTHPEPPELQSPNLRQTTPKPPQPSLQHLTRPPGTSGTLLEPARASLAWEPSPKVSSNRGDTWECLRIREPPPQKGDDGGGKSRGRKKASQVLNVPTLPLKPAQRWHLLGSFLKTNQEEAATIVRKHSSERGAILGKDPF